MSTMQIFYAWLFQTPEVHNPSLESLARLAKSSPAQITTALKSELEWFEWGTGSSETSAASAPTTE